MFKKIHLSK